jgi:hypothetical protein
VSIVIVFADHTGLFLRGVGYASLVIGLDDHTGSFLPCADYAFLDTELANHKGVDLALNPACQQVYGCSEAELVGTPREGSCPKPF